MENSSRRSSGCQSGWTLYLDHSGGGGGYHLHPRCRQCRSLSCKNRELGVLMTAGEEQEAADDSMVSDASSGPPPSLRGRCDDDEEEEELRDQARQRQQRLLNRRRHLHGCHGSYCDAGSTGVGSRSTPSSHSLAEAKSWGRRKRSAVDVDAAAIVVVLRHGEHDARGDDDLDDTASSSAVSSGLQPSCVFSAIRLQQWSSSPAAVQGTSVLHGSYAMLHRN
uniref:Uncharacterized protein n=1 Tax=Oryza brachyantha TaxID=4533 RepID=J3LWZ1_ORYBR